MLDLLLMEKRPGQTFITRYEIGLRGKDGRWPYTAPCEIRAK